MCVLSYWRVFAYFIEGSGKTVIICAIGVWSFHGTRCSCLIILTVEVIWLRCTHVGSFKIIIFKTISTCFNFLIDMLDNNRIKPMFMLELLCQFIIIIILMEKDTIDLIIINFNFDDSYDSITGIPMRGPRLFALD